MTHDGVKRVMQVLVASYPNFHPADMRVTMDVWEKLLANYNDAQVAKALEAYILSDTKGFAPAIGQIVDILTQNPDEMSELEAWSLVQRAVRNGNYGAEEEFMALPPDVQVAVGSPGQIREWALMESDSMGVAQSNFLRSYRTVCDRERKAVKMPPEVARLYKHTVNAITTQKQPETVKNGIPMPEELKERLKNVLT